MLIKLIKKELIEQYFTTLTLKVSRSNCVEAITAELIQVLLLLRQK